MTVKSRKRAIPVLPDFFPAVLPQSRYYQTFFWRYYRNPGTTGLFPGTTAGQLLAETASRKLQYLLNPNSEFDDLGLVLKIMQRTIVVQQGGIEINQERFYLSIKDNPVKPPISKTQ